MRTLGTLSSSYTGGNSRGAAFYLPNLVHRRNAGDKPLGQQPDSLVLRLLL